MHIAIVCLLSMPVIFAYEVSIRPITRRHLQYRNTVNAANMMDLTWDRELAKIGDEFAKKCPSSAESLIREGRELEYGINVGAMAVETKDGEKLSDRVQIRIIDTWGGQRTYFQHPNICSGGTCDQWIQMIWADVSTFGCGLNKCQNEAVMVCVYDKKANPEHEPTFLIGNPCSKCKEGYQKCVKNKCVFDGKKIPLREPDVKVRNEIVQPHTTEKQVEDISQKSTEIIEEVERHSTPQSKEEINTTVDEDKNETLIVEQRGSAIDKDNNSIITKCSSGTVMLLLFTSLYFSGIYL